MFVKVLVHPGDAVLKLSYGIWTWCIPFFECFVTHPSSLTQTDEDLDEEGDISRREEKGSRCHE